MGKLVVFYSRAGENYFGGEYRHVEVGNTEKVAEIIAKEVNGELFKIEQKKPYSPDYKICIDQAMADQREAARPVLKELPENLDDYDEIYLGYPNYWGDMPMAVYTFLESFDWTGKTIYPFCTHEGSGLSNTERNIAAVCKEAMIKKGLAVFGSHAEQCKTAVLQWLEENRKDGSQ